MKVFRAVAMGLQSGEFSLSVAGGHSQAVMTENKKMTLLLGMINEPEVVFAIGTTSYLTPATAPPVTRYNINNCNDSIRPEWFYCRILSGKI